MDLTIALLGASIHLDEKDGDMETVKRVTARWETDFVRPLYAEFVSSFSASVHSLLYVPEFEELQRL